MKPDFSTMVSQNQGIIHKVCRLYRDTPEDREDLFQDIVYHLWRSYPTFKGEAKMSTWIYKIALSAAVLEFRSPKEKFRRQHLPLTAIEATAAFHDAPREERISRLYSVIATFDPLEKAVVTLYLEEYSYEEIAGIVGITRNHVGVKLNRIKSKLKDMLALKEEDNG